MSFNIDHESQDAKPGLGPNNPSPLGFEHTSRPCLTGGTRKQGRALTTRQDIRNTYICYVN